MGMNLSLDNFNEVFQKISEDYKIYAPKLFKGKGTYTDTDIVKYAEITNIDEMVVEQKSDFSYKEVIMPVTQTLFYFTEDKWQEPKIDEKKILIFLRSCDLHSVKRLDDIYLRNGFTDPYYKALRDKTKFVLLGCEHSFENCFCVSMGTNKPDKYDSYFKRLGNNIYFATEDKELEEYFSGTKKEKITIAPDFVTANKVKVNIPDNLNLDIIDSKIWDEYSQRCIGCGRCNFVCPTCTCFTMQDIFYEENKNVGERRRVWSSCQVDGYTDIAGGHSFRKDKGQRMRFKVMHKAYDYKKRWGYHMCVGCGRCDDICPEYISFSNCLNKLERARNEVGQDE